MSGGYAGKILEVDLTSQKIKKTPLDMDEARMFIGGRGLGAKWLWDRTKAGGSYLDPDNPLCFMSGPLNGLPAPSTGRLTVVTRSASTFPKSNPATTGICHTNTGGRWTPELKFAGYDAVIVTGASYKPVGIVIENDNVQIVPADRYWGMGIYDLQNALDQDLSRQHKSVYIGPGGENLVRYASIMTEIHRAAGRGGAGAVMGSKKLKFIAVRGTQAIGIDDKNAWKTANKQAWTELLASGGFHEWRKYGTAMVLTASSDWGSEAVYNFREGTYEYADELSAEKAYRNLWVGDDACYMCPIACLHRGVIRKGRFSGMTHDGPEYEGVMMGANCGVRDLAGWMANTSASDDYGLCYISMGNVLGFLMEAYEKGIIQATDLDGIPMKWGDVDAMLEIQKKVAYAEGCGKLLGRNLRALVDAWGKDCEDFAIETKGQGWAAWNTRALEGFETTYLTANRGADHLTGADIATQNARVMNDSLGICLFPQLAGFKSESMNALLNAATGYRFSMADYWKSAERIYTLERSFNVANGFTRADDTVPPRMYKEALSVGAAKGKILSEDGISKLLDQYYADRGWDKNGIPTKARLEELGLGFVSLSPVALKNTPRWGPRNRAGPLPSHIIAQHRRWPSSRRPACSALESVMTADDRIWLKEYDSWVPADITIPDVTYLELLERAFDEFPTKPACRFLETSLSFYDLDRFSKCFAAFLSQSGCRPGDVVAINLPNTPQFLIAHTGALRANCLPTGLSPLLSSREMAYQLNDCRARLLVTVASTLEDKFLPIRDQVPELRHVVACNPENFNTRETPHSPGIVERSAKKYSGFMDILQDFKPQRLPPGPNPRDVCLIQYTGGTTGPPKGTMLTHRNLVADILQCNQWLKIQRGAEVYLPAFPFSHLAGLALGLTALGMGHTQIIIPNPRDTRHICHQIARHRPTVMAFVPSLYRMLLQDTEFKTLDFSSCRICLSGAAPLALDLMAEIESVVGEKKVVEVYGLTETFILTMNPYQGKKKTGSVGIPLQSTRVKIVDLETGKQEMPPGEEGELIARGPQIMKGYYHMPGETERTLRTFEQQKWIFTGDVARMDADGYLNIVDRLKDMIIVGGYKVFSREVEEVLSEHPAVAISAVVGLPNPERPGSELVKAVIQPAAEYGNMTHDKLEGELKAYCRKNMAPYKVPGIMEFVEAIPLTAVGKVDKKLLKSSKIG